MPVAPVAAPTVRVTMMSVPTLDRGDSTSLCALLRPSETPMIPMTRPTPAARPSAVTTVRLQRLRSSLPATRTKPCFPNARDR